MILTSQIIKPYIAGLHLGSYTYLFSNILDHTISRTQTLELIEKIRNCIFRVRFPIS